MHRPNLAEWPFLVMLALLAGATGLGCREAVPPPAAAKPAAEAAPAPGAAEPTAESPPSASSTVAVEQKPSPARLPRLLDLGAGKCIPCKMMAPILEELKAEYAGTFDVEFIDVWQNPQAAEKYGIESIPTQIFFDASGQERFRHVGFFSKEEILATWKELGVEKGN